MQVSWFVFDLVYGKIVRSSQTMYVRYYTYLLHLFDGLYKGMSCEENVNY